jgi:RNA polymerase sigma factor (sigma-70 family)
MSYRSSVRPVATSDQVFLRAARLGQLRNPGVDRKSPTRPGFRIRDTSSDLSSRTTWKIFILALDGVRPSTGMDSEPTDKDLLSQLSTDPAAFETFYWRHLDRVIGFAARRVREPPDVADVVAATFLTVLTAARSYDPGRGEPSAWLLGITARLIANENRRRYRENAATARIIGRRLIDASDIERLEERIDAARSSQQVAEALSRLKPGDREVLLLVSADGLTPAEAARVLGIGAAACRMRLTSARRALSKAIDKAAPRPAAELRSPNQNSSMKETSGEYRYAR